MRLRAAASASVASRVAIEGGHNLVLLGSIVTANELEMSDT